MNTKRRTKAPYAGQKGRCAWCGTKDLPPRRKSWCSQKCVDEYLMRNSTEHIRRAVWERDKGICALCGCDANAEFKAWKQARSEISKLAHRLAHASRFNMEWSCGRWVFEHEDRFPTYREIETFTRRLMRKYMSSEKRWTAGRSTGWDADHIIPVCEGGGNCGIENFRTLCHPCHKEETAKLAKRRAKNRMNLSRK